MNKIARIRQEIERRKKENMYVDLPMSIGRYYEDRDLLAFIDSLSEEPVSDDLEEAAMNYIAPIENEDGLKVINFSGRDIKDAFKAGAYWQKEQMLKDAVEGEVVKDISNKLAVTAKNINLDGFRFGDKVRIIIVKEESK